MPAQHAMPAIRTVNHLLSDGRIIVVAHDGPAIVARADHAAETSWPTS
ncbi:MAG TPA: hypothetical protein VHZ03_53860 [Trebonia sp.]|nr:hypothetical protein [Trebonia sp.]